MDASSVIYRVKGYIPITPPPIDSVASAPSEKSLQVKPMKPHEGLAGQGQDSDTTARPSEASVDRRISVASTTDARNSTTHGEPPSALIHETHDEDHARSPPATAVSNTTSAADLSLIHI